MPEQSTSLRIEQTDPVMDERQMKSMFKLE